MLERTIDSYQERICTLTSILPVVLYIVEPDAGLRGPHLPGRAIRGALGFRPSDLLKNDELWPSRIHGEDAPATLAAAAAASKSGILSSTYRWRCADGTERRFLDRGIIALCDGERQRKLVGVCLDVTNPHEAKRLLHELSQYGIVSPPSEGATYKDVVHDIENLLTVVIWNLERAAWQIDARQSPWAEWMALHAALTTAVPPPRRQRSGVAVREKESPPKNSYTVLVVEDDPDVREITVARLEDMGHRVREADGAQAALDMLRNGLEIDLLFTDIKLPGPMSGCDLARHALAHDPRIKLLLASGETPPRETLRDLRGEALLKPYRREDLASAIDRAVRAASCPSR